MSSATLRGSVFFASFPRFRGNRAETPADAADGEDAAVAADGEVAAGEAAGEEKKKRASSVTTKTKTGGGEHTRFASTPATTDEFRGDSDMGSDSDGRDLVAEVG